MSQSSGKPKIPPPAVHLPVGSPRAVIPVPPVVQCRKGRDLVKRYQLPADAITHIFDGEVNGGNFDGFHSEQVKNPGNNQLQIVSILPAQALRRNSGTQAYSMHVRVKFGAAWKGPALGTRKSFFPRNWTQDRIVMWIEQALTHPGRARHSRQDWAARPERELLVYNDQIRVNGVRCIVQYHGNVVDSVYPDL
jgi:hypothetical protein